MNTAIATAKTVAAANALTDTHVDTAINANLYTTNQDKLLMRIIYRYITNNKSQSIQNINKEINNAFYRLIARNNNGKRYNIQNKGFKNIFLKKIKNYSFDIELLDKIYGKDKNGDSKLINIIAYAYNIMNLVCYNNNPVPNNLNDKNKINSNIDQIVLYKGLTPHHTIKGEESDFIRQMFKYACYNCFYTHFDKFEKYINGKIYNLKAANFPCIPYIYKPLNGTNKLISYSQDFKKAEFDISTDTIVIKSLYNYYDNIEKYEHSVMYEYAENVANIKRILIIFGIVLVFVLVLCFLYWIANLKFFNFIPVITCAINFCHLFYEYVTFGITIILCSYYCIIFCKNSNSYSIGSIIANIFNILIIISAFVMLYYAFMELLNIDYYSLLQDLKPDKFWFTEDGNQETFINMILYIFLSYIIIIYFYSIYIVRYSLTANEYDIIGNKDADYKVSIKYINYILLKTYNEGLLSKYMRKYQTIYDSAIA